MKADLKVVGFSQELPRRIAASSTRFYAGEPLHGLGTLSSGAINTNTFVVAAADTPVIGTHRFGGIAIKDALPPVANGASATLVAHTTLAACPIPWLGRLRGKGETAADIDTEAEALGLIGDAVLIDYAATGSPSGGPLYTIKTAGSADTSALEIAEVNVAKGLVDAYVDGRAYRHDVS